MQIGRFFSNIVGGEPKTPKPLQEAKQHPVLKLVTTSIGHVCTCFNLNLDNYKKVEADLVEGKIVIKIGF